MKQRQEEGGIIGPRPRDLGTRFRVCGPYVIRGMSVWRVFSTDTAEQLGGDCFSFHEARERAIDLASGRVRFFFQGIPFERSDGCGGKKP